MLQNKQKIKLKQIAELIEAKLQGDENCEINGIAPLDRAEAGQISFITNAKFRSVLTSSRASAIIAPAKEATHCVTQNILIVDDPYLAYAKVATLFQPKRKVNSGIHPTATIGTDCQIDPSASIAAHCVIGDRVIVGKNTIISPGCVIADDCVIGADNYFYPNVTLYSDVKIADRALIHSGVVIGSDGFGMARDGDEWFKIPQLGGVTIGNDVEIGANTCIDRGALVDTVIEDDVKLDNLIQIAHNVTIGAHTAIAGCTAIAGSTHIGKNCLIGGGASIAGHLELVEGVILLGTATVESSITEPGMYGSGTGLLPARELAKNLIRYRQLNEMAKKLNKLEKTLDERDGHQ